MFVSTVVWRTYVLLLGTCLLLSAQSDTSLISGFVRDPSGSLVPNASVLVRNEATGQERRTTTDQSGYYVVSSLASGYYTVAVEAPGFKRTEVTRNKLDPNLPLQVSVTLSVGPLSESIQVTAQANPVQADSASVGRFVTREQIENLLLNGRDPAILAQLLPGVTRRGSISSFSFGLQNYRFNVNGSQERENQITVDGAPAMRFRAATFPIGIADLDSTQEVQILTANYRAEYGRSAGGQIRIVTKSGSKEFHGTAYEYLRNNALDANSWERNRNPDPAVNSGPAPFRFNQFGYNFSGPVILPRLGFNRDRSKLFFLWGQEYTRFRQEQSASRRAPTLAMRTGDFSELLAASNIFYGRSVAVRDPLANTPFPNNLIPPSRTSKNGLGLLKAFPPPTPGFSQGGNNVFLLGGAPQDQRKDTASVDYLLKERHFFRFRYLHHYIERYYPFQGNWDRGRGWLNFYNHVASVNYTWTISPSLVNEFLASYSIDRVRRRIDRSYPTWEKSQYGIDFPYIFPIGKARPFMIPDITIQGLTALATNKEGYTNSPIYTISNSLAKTAGRHIVKAGFYFERAGQNENSGAFEAGAFTFTDARTGAPTSGAAIANAALGLFDVYTEVAPANYALYRSHVYEYFVQDSWKVRERLQLEYGCRHSLVEPYYTLWNNGALFAPRFYDPARAAVIDPARGNVTGGDPLNGMIIPGNGFPRSAMGRLSLDPEALKGLFRGVGRGFSHFHKRDIQPRLGAAYMLTDRSVVRAALGRYVLRNPMNDAFSPGTNPPFQDSAYLANGNVDHPSGGTGLRFPLSPGTQDEVLGNPQSWMWNASWETSLPAGMLLNLGYVGRRGLNATRFININQMPAGTVQANRGVNQNALRPYRGYGSLLAVVNDGQSKYHSFQLALSRRYQQGLQYGVSYTLARSRDNSSYGEILPNTYDDKPFWGPSSFDFRHVLVLNFAWDLPVFRTGSGWTRRLLGGWQISGITQFQAGAPFTVQTADDFAGVGAGSGPQIWGIKGDPVLPKDERKFANSTSDANYWFRTTNPDGTRIFTAPAAGTFTTQNNRNRIYNPGFQDWSLSLRKAFQVTERQSLQFRVEAFNWVNHPNWGGANTNPNNLATFGKVLTKSGERVMQLSLRYSL